MMTTTATEIAMTLTLEQLKAVTDWFVSGAFQDSGASADDARELATACSLERGRRFDIQMEIDIARDMAAGLFA